jgi:hypothetical protein
MSGFGAGQFDDADGAGSIERRIQEELRARQASAAASRVTGALRGQGFSTDRAFMNSLIAAESAAAGNASPYYGQRAAAQAHAASAFGRGPYAGLTQPGANAYGVGHNPSDAVAASLYARQRAQYAGAYGAAAASAGADAQRFHGYGVPGADLYSQHFGRSAQEMSLIDRAAAYNAQQRQAEQQNAALLQQAVASKSPSGSISASTLSYMQKGTPKQVLSPQSAKATPRQTPTTPATPATASPAAPKSTPRPKAPKNRPSAVRSSGTPGSSSKNTKNNLVSMDKDAKDGAEDDAEAQKWFSGCVPLGLEDDKYWLSELQVYLRANFAESFGATEEDIAAPMHGRNKPIALGQVGIRCMHCKREYQFFFLREKIVCRKKYIVFLTGSILLFLFFQMKILLNVVNRQQATPV